MHNIKSFNNFTFNLIKLQNYVNKNYTPVRKDDIKLIMFNAVISSYPDQKWMSLEDSFFQNIPSEDIELTIIYTILSYKLGTFFTKCNPLIKTDLINALLIYSVNIYKIHKYAIYLLSGELLKLTEYAYNNHLIKPRHIYKIILDNFMLDKVDEKKQEEILAIIKKFVITGTIDGYGRKEIKEIIESFNGSVSESVSKNTDIVIVGSNPGSKYQDALKLNIMIWDNDKTVEVLNNLPKA